MAELFDKDVRTINEHIKNIYQTEELEIDLNYPEIPDSSTERAKTSTKKMYLQSLMDFL
ncbi:MAG: hypothetical protein PHH37_12240 [Paludibacter sp.]|nr:hypothetical protein [Paludibacter sp.]